MSFKDMKSYLNRNKNKKSEEFASLVEDSRKVRKGKRVSFEAADKLRRIVKAAKQPLDRKQVESEYFGMPTEYVEKIFGDIIWAASAEFDDVERYTKPEYLRMLKNIFPIRKNGNKMIVKASIAESDYVFSIDTVDNGYSVEKEECGIVNHNNAYQLLVDRFDYIKRGDSVIEKKLSSLKAMSKGVYGPEIPYDTVRGKRVVDILDKYPSHFDVEKESVENSFNI